MDKIVNPDAWAEFGLGGLVSLALFALVWHLLSQHKGERGEWREDSVRRDEKLTKALEAVERAIRSNSNG